ncbi:MAG: alpha/beta hydrolase [Verrucomicrobia bacterium]|nr:MAG: alpha/beta hydrolase [Verrucomicrobiota bacterium]
MRTFSVIIVLFCAGCVEAADAISSRDAKIDNVQLHYLTAGKEQPAVILLHGFAETSRMWRPIMPTLAEKFTVIAPDLPGIGDSSIPTDNKIDIITAAKQIHDLVHSLKIEKARVVGHDIGLKADRRAYTEAYSKPGRMRAAWTYFVSWPQLAKDFAQLSQTKLTMPVLSIGGEKSLGNKLGAQMKLVADNVTVIVLPNTGHWILEEKPKETTNALVNFL